MQLTYGAKDANTEKPVESKAAIFRPDAVKLLLGDKEFTLTYDLNAFCELEKIYGSIDVVFKKVLGNPFAGNSTVAYKGALVNTDDITVGDTPLTQLLGKLTAVDKATSADTLNIVYCGLLRDAAVYNEHDEIVSYSVSKAWVGRHITLKNLQAANAAAAAGLLRDMIASTDGETKNAEAPAAE